MWSGTDAPHAWLSILSVNRNTVHISITCKSLHLYDLHPNHSSLQAPFPSKTCSHSFRHIPLRDRCDRFLGSVWGQPGHYLRGVLGLLGQLGLRASHASNSCSVTDMRKGITEALWAHGGLGGFFSLLGGGCSHREISSSVQRWQSNATQSKDLVNTEIPPPQKKERKKAMKNKLSPAPKFMPIWISSSMCQWRVSVTVWW